MNLATLSFGDFTGLKIVVCVLSMIIGMILVSSWVFLCYIIQGQKICVLSHLSWQLVSNVM